MAEEKDLFKLTSIDEYGSRINIVPAQVRGFFRTQRNRLHLVLVVIFLVLPWLHYNGQQLILIDIPSRKFNFFGMLFRAHDAPLIFLLLITFILTLALVTSIWGRVWCGWACPQTVFIDAIFRRIETWTEGSYIDQRRLRKSSWTAEKFKKTGSKWILFLIVSSLIAHSFIAYFIGSIELLKMMQGSPFSNWNYFLLVAFFTAIIFFDFAWFREQFCVIMCPYGRIQSILLEPTSLAIVYDHSRGEPRKSATPKNMKSGDCVSCNRCVQVCPTGIDIRNGLQMECIACTACIDACDEIMEKVEKPKGLISYRTLDSSPLKIFKFKTFAYGFLILLSVGILLYNISSREPVNITVLRGIDTPYTISKNQDGTSQILNHFRIHLTNQTYEPSKYKIHITESETLRGVTLTVAQNPITIKPDESFTWHVFIKAPQSEFTNKGQLELKFYIQNEKDEVFEKSFSLIGPRQ